MFNVLISSEIGLILNVNQTIKNQAFSYDWPAIRGYSNVCYMKSN